MDCTKSYIVRYPAGICRSMNWGCSCLVSVSVCFQSTSCIRASHSIGGRRMGSNGFYSTCARLQYFGQSSLDLADCMWCVLIALRYVFLWMGCGSLWSSAIRVYIRLLSRVYARHWSWLCFKVFHDGGGLSLPKCECPSVYLGLVMVDNDYQSF